MNREKLRSARRSGFLYGLFKASTIPTPILPKNLALEVFEQEHLKPPKTLDEMRNYISSELGFDSVGFIPTVDKQNVKMIYTPYKKKDDIIIEEEEEKRPKKKKARRAPEEDELVIEPGDYADLEVGIEDPNDLLIEPDQDMKARQRYKQARRDYRNEQKKQKRQDNPELQRLTTMFKGVDSVEPFINGKQKKKK